MKRSKRNVDELGAYSDLLLYAILLSFLIFFLSFHAICAFIVTGFATKGFVGDWSSVLMEYLTEWSVIRWTVGIPIVLYFIQVFRVGISSARCSANAIEELVCEIEQKSHPGCAVCEIRELNRNQYLDALYEETYKMCRAAKIKMPRLFFVNTPDLNGYTTTAGDGTHGVVLLRGLMDAMSFTDVKAVIAHELGHIISKDVAYGRVIGYAIGAMTSFWLLGQVLVKVVAESLFHPADGEDPNPVAWIGGILALVLGDVLILFGGFSNYCGRAIGWLRDRQAEFIADSRGAALLDDEQEFADMIIVLHCSAVIQMPLQLTCLRALTCPGAGFGTLDVHPDDVDRVRRIRPSFDGNFKRAYLEIINNRRKEQCR